MNFLLFIIAPVNFTMYLDITNVQKFLKAYEKEINKITDNKQHIINAFLVFCLYKRSVGSL